MAELKPCKKCDDFNAYESGPWFSDNFGWCICCDNCGNQTPIYRDLKAAISAWNKRS